MQQAVCGAIDVVMADARSHVAMPMSAANTVDGLEQQESPRGEGDRQDT